MIEVAVAYAEGEDQIWKRLEVAEGTTVVDAIEASGILESFPAIDLEKQKIGIFGKFTALNGTVSHGDRIEIYRPITADPKKAKKRLAGME
jgi:putative ubiquitin-RnfH superfamily antitoxin RatB of RatAB toxin-antitoxin module